MNRPVEILALLVRCLLGALVPVVLAVVSWYLEGNQVWAWVTGVTGLILLVTAVVNLEALGGSDLQRRDFLIAGYAVLCWGSWAAVGYFFPLTTVRVKGGNAEAETACPRRVSYEGVVRSEDERGLECSFQIRGRFRSDRLKIETLTPQRWVERTFRGDGEVEMDPIPTTTIYLDNRNRKEVKLACGHLSFNAPADNRSFLRIPALLPGTRCPLSLDGKEVGEIADQNVLVDALGTRSYRLCTVNYGGGLEQAMARLRPGSEPQNEPIVLRGSCIHPLPGKIDYFLEPAPQQITVRTVGVPGLGKETRTELLEGP